MAEKSRRDIMHDIEAKHLGRCIDQVWRNGRKTLIELMEIKNRPGDHVVVVKQFEQRVPTMGSSKPWPDLSAVWLYVPIDDRTNTWDGLDRALQIHRDMLTKKEPTA